MGTLRNQKLRCPFMVSKSILTTKLFAGLGVAKVLHLGVVRHPSCPLPPCATTTVTQGVVPNMAPNPALRAPWMRFGLLLHDESAPRGVDHHVSDELEPDGVAGG